VHAEPQQWVPRQRLLVHWKSAVQALPGPPNVVVVVELLGEVVVVVVGTATGAQTSEVGFAVAV
jgi:hypothetical protein